MAQAPRRPTAADKRKARRKSIEQFKAARKAEKSYARQLRAVAQQVGMIVKGFAPDGKVRPRQIQALQRSLDEYAALLRPWAAEVSSQMLGRVNAGDVNAWMKHAQEMGAALTKEIATAPTGQVMQMLMIENVDLITSIPRKAAERVHQLTMEAISSTSARSDEIAQEIMRTTRVTESRAKLIARTEVARTASILTQSRSEYVGSTHYIWRTVGDADVRDAHRKLEGKVIAWDSPPIAGSNGERAHAGQIYNCRCYPEPILPDVIT